MALDSMQEIFDKIQAGRKPFWQVVRDTDVEERQVTAEASFEKMHATWRAMVESVDTYRADRRSVSGLVTSVAWSVNGKTTYALEGSVFNAGSSIQWLRDELGLIGTAHECDILAESVPDNGGVYLVSAFTGLGAPRWDMYARGAIVGLTRGSNKAHIARATLEGIAYQVKDLLDAMQVDAESPISVLRVDGGASVSSFLMQFQADMLRVPIDRPKLVETTAFGAAFLAGLACGVWESVDDIALLRQSDRIFKPEMDAEQAKQYHDNWLRAVGRAEKWSQE